MFGLLPENLTIDRLRLDQPAGFVMVEGYLKEGKLDMQTKMMVALFGLFAEVERDLISERTKEGLVAARAKGRLLGRPKGSLGTSKLDGKEGEIRMLLEKQVSKASIAKIVGVVDQPPSLRPNPTTRSEGRRNLGPPSPLEHVLAAIWAVS